ncbi:alpha/beta hydrolase [Lapidilactobacillus wuchangensis]|uniref:alpha/beta hydrolase n=1 Tax=Lapidilactobacillus wuchangensis TaxID=2486001 RepID=UPI001CDBC8C2|nr:alpha/beta hydrolase [Lapidilactobacillus wuchangensis]
MTKMKRVSLFIVSLLAGIFLLATVALNRQRRTNEKKYVTSQTVTIFVHGWGSSYLAEKHMANAAKNAGVTNTIIRANVSKKGRVKFLGRIKSRDKNPIVEVNLADNKTPEGTERSSQVKRLYHQSGTYVKNVVVALKNKFSVHHINFVGHSMGNLLISYYLLDNATNQNLPIVDHQVVIAGHYDGIKDMQPYSVKSTLNSKGRPSILTPEYVGLLGLRKKFPKQAKVLNIFGDVGDRYHSDGQVTSTSARSYQYLASRAKQYRELKITGYWAHHSLLHENKTVDKNIINFLWAKHN